MNWITEVLGVAVPYSLAVKGLQALLAGHLITQEKNLSRFPIGERPTPSAYGAVGGRNSSIVLVETTAVRVMLSTAQFPTLTLGVNDGGYTRVTRRR